MAFWTSPLAPSRREGPSGSFCDASSPSVGTGVSVGRRRANGVWPKGRTERLTERLPRLFAGVNWTAFFLSKLRAGRVERLGREPGSDVRAGGELGRAEKKGVVGSEAGEDR